MQGYQPSKNGGLFTGNEAPKDAPWAAIPVVPDVDYMIHYNLRSANPPPGAIYQYPGNVRPGNNTQTFPGLTPYLGNKNFGPFNFMCAPCTTEKAETCPNNMWCIGDNSWKCNANKVMVPID